MPELPNDTDNRKDKSKGASRDLFSEVESTMAETAVSVDPNQTTSPIHATQERPFFGPTKLGDAGLKINRELGAEILDYLGALGSATTNSTWRSVVAEIKNAHEPAMAFAKRKEQLLPGSLAQRLLGASELELSDELLTIYFRQVYKEEIVLRPPDRPIAGELQPLVGDRSGPILLTDYFLETKRLAGPLMERRDVIFSRLFYGTEKISAEQRAYEEPTFEGEKVAEFWGIVLEKAKEARKYLALYEAPLDPSSAAKTPGYTVLADFLKHVNALEGYLADMKLVGDVARIFHINRGIWDKHDLLFSLRGLFSIACEKRLQLQAQLVPLVAHLLENIGAMARATWRGLAVLADFYLVFQTLPVWMRDSLIAAKFRKCPAEAMKILAQQPISPLEKISTFASYLQWCLGNNIPIDALIVPMPKDVLLWLFDQHPAYARLLQSPAAVNKLNDDELFEIITTKLSFLGYFEQAIQQNEALIARMTPEICFKIIKKITNYEQLIFAEPKLMVQFSGTQLFDILVQSSGKPFLIFAKHCGGYLDRLAQEQFVNLISKYGRLKNNNDYRKSLAFIQFHFLKKFSPEHLDNELTSLKGADWLENEATRAKVQDAYQAYLDAKKKQAEGEARKKAEDAEKNLAMRQLSYLRYYTPHLLRADPHLQPLEKSEVGLENKAIRIKVANVYDADVKALRERAADAAKLPQLPVSDSPDVSQKLPEQTVILPPAPPPMHRMEIPQTAQSQELAEQAPSSVPSADQVKAPPANTLLQRPVKDQKSLGCEEQSHDVSVNKPASVLPSVMLPNQPFLEACQVVASPLQASRASLSDEEQPPGASTHERTLVPVASLVVSQNPPSSLEASQYEQPAERVATAATIASVAPNLQERAASALSLSLVEEEEQARKTNSYQAFSSARIQPQPSYVSLSSLMGSTYGREELRSTNERNIETYPPPNMTRESMAPQDSSTRNLPTVTSASVTGWRWLFRGILGAGGGYLVVGGIAALIKGSALLGISVAAAPAALALGGLLLLGVWVDIIYRAAISEIASQNSSTHKATQYSPSFRPPSGHTPVYAPSPSQEVVQPQPSTTLSRR